MIKSSQAQRNKKRAKEKEGSALITWRDTAHMMSLLQEFSHADSLRSLLHYCRSSRDVAAAPVAGAAS
jgi:hypothetical protein